MLDQARLDMIKAMALPEDGHMAFLVRMVGELLEDSVCPECGVLLGHSL